jgi:hypothetical protein
MSGHAVALLAEALWYSGSVPDKVNCISSLDQPLTEMRTKNPPAIKERPVRMAKHLSYISTACYGDSFTLWRRSVLPVRYELDCKYCYK